MDSNVSVTIWSDFVLGHTFESIGMCLALLGNFIPSLAAGRKDEGFYIRK